MEKNVPLIRKKEVKTQIKNDFAHKKRCNDIAPQRDLQATLFKFIKVCTRQ
jgi:hypothetical protein